MGLHAKKIVDLFGDDLDTLSSESIIIYKQGEFRNPIMILPIYEAKNLVDQIGHALCMDVKNAIEYKENS